MARSRKRRITKANTPRRKKLKREVTSEPSSRFLALPAELRNNIYEKVLEIYPEARLSRNTRQQRNLATECRLVSVCRQVRREFLAILFLAAPVICTTVKRFHFGHLITFFNRLSDAELNTMLKKDPSVPTNRLIKIELEFPLLRVSIGDQLQRWLNRVEHPTKKGTNVEFEYVVSGYRPALHYIARYQTHPPHTFYDVLTSDKMGSRGSIEGVKICNAMEGR